MSERTSASYLNKPRPPFVSIDAEDYPRHLESLLAVTSRAEILSAFAYNNQQGSPERQRKNLVIDAGPIAMDAFTEVDTLYRLGIIDEEARRLSGFGRYIIQSLSLDPAELELGNLVPIRLEED